MTSPSIANKGVSERIVTAPFSPLGQDTHVDTQQRHLHGAADQPADRARLRNDAPRRCATASNQEQAFHPIYNYAVVTDAEEGLILVDVNTLADGDPRNNNLKRAVTWNEDGVLDGARHITLAGHYRLYRRRRAGWWWSTSTIRCSRATSPTVPLTDARASALQFRYLWVTDAEGLKLFDVTHLAEPVPVPSATVPLADARRIYLARTYAYVAAKQRRPGDRQHHQSRARRASTSCVTFDGRMNDVEDVDRRLDQRLAVRLCRRRPERHEGAAAHQPGQPAQLLRLLAARRSPS